MSVGCRLQLTKWKEKFWRTRTWLWQYGLQGYFRDPGFNQNAVLDSRKVKISLRKAGSYSYSGIILGIRETIRLSSKLSGVSFHSGNRLPRIKLNYRACFLNYFFIIIIVIQYCFWKQKRNSGKRCRKVRGVGFSWRRSEFSGSGPPPRPLSDPVTQVEIQLPLLENKW